MKNTVLIIFIALFLSSCATLLNSRTEKLKIITSKPSRIVIRGDTLRNFRTQKYMKVKRDEAPLSISVVSDSITKNISVKSRNSFTYWLNLFPTPMLWTGFLIDKNNPKRFTYPHTIYIDINSDKDNYLTYKPLDCKMSKYHNIIKITPPKLWDLINPGIEISYERKTGNYFATQMMVSYLLPISIWDIGDDFKPAVQGFSVALEEKFYFRKSAPKGPYIGLEFNYMKNQYKDICRFSVKNNYLDTTNNNTNYPDTIGIKKQTFSINLKFGYQLFIKRISLDFYIGLGLRYKDIRHFDRINPNDEMEKPRHPNVYYITNLNGQYWTLSIPINIKIGWTF